MNIFQKLKDPGFRIFFFSVLGLFGALSVIFLSYGPSSTISFIGFLVLIICCLVVYQSFERVFPRTWQGALFFFLGRLVFCSAIVFITYRVMLQYQDRIFREGYTIITTTVDSVTSTYRRGNKYYAHFHYEIGGTRVVKSFQSSKAGRYEAGDTLFLKIATNDPYLMRLKYVKKREVEQ